MEKNLVKLIREDIKLIWGYIKTDTDRKDLLERFIIKNEDGELDKHYTDYELIIACAQAEG